MECEFCVIAEKGEKIFEDEKIFAFLNPKQASRGHIVVAPKEHFTILEQVPDFVAGHLFSIANKVSTVHFEKLMAHGTNIIVENGSSAGQRVAHFSINVIPRSENDGMGFIWQPKTLSEEELSTTELQLKEQASSIGGFEKEKKEITIDEPKEVLPTGEEDYLLKQLRRLP